MCIITMLNDFFKVYEGEKYFLNIQNDLFLTPLMLCKMVGITVWSFNFIMTLSYSRGMIGVGIKSTICFYDKQSNSIATFIQFIYFTFCNVMIRLIIH